MLLAVAGRIYSPAAEMVVLFLVLTFTAAASFNLSTKCLFSSDANIIVSRATAFMSKQHVLNVGINN